MASPLSKCTTLIAKEFKDLDPEDLDVFTKELERRQGGLAPGAFKDIIETMAVAQNIDAQRLRHQQLSNVRAKINLTRFIIESFPDNPAKGLEAAMVGIQRARKGALDSAAAGQRALSNQYLSSFAFDLDRTGFRQEFISGELDRDISVAMHRMGEQEIAEISDRAALSDGLSEKAVAVANVIRKWNDVVLEDANRSGALIRRDPSYITKQTHNSLKLRRAAKIVTGIKSSDDEVNFIAWRDFVTPLLDPERTFADIADVDEFMRSTYDATASGIHLTHAGANMAPNVITRLKSVAKRMSQRRLIHFKDGDAFFTYNKTFGSDRLVETIFSGLDSNAHNIGLMRKFGPNARNNYEEVFTRFLKATKNQTERTKFEGSRPKLNRFFDALDGSDRVPDNVIAAQVAATARAIQSFSKLGSATISAITDIEFVSSTLRANGVPWFQSYQQSLESIFKKKSSEDKKQLISMIGVANDGMRGRIMSRLSTDDSDPGQITKALSLYFRLNLLTPWTDNARSGMSLVLSNNLGLNSGKKFSSLPEELSRELDKFGITSDEWDVIRKALETDTEGRVYVVPEKLRESSDVDIDKLIVPEREAVIRAAQGKLGALADKQSSIAERVAKRVRKFKQIKSKKANRRARVSTRIGKKAKGTEDELRLRNQELRLREELAEIDGEVAALIELEKSETRILGILDAVEEGTARDPLGKASRALARLTKRQRDSAEQLGRRKGRIAKQLEDINRTINNGQSAAIAKARKVTTKQGKKDLEFLGERLSELAEFTVEMEAEFKRTKIATQAVAKLLDDKLDDIRNVKREELEATFRKYFAEQVDDGVLTPGVRTEATLRGGTRPGSPVGIAMSFIMQFKAFPVALAQRVVTRELFGRGAESLSDLSGKEFLGVMQLMAGSTAFGYIAMSLKDLSRGRSLREPETTAEWWDLTRTAALQGGGLGIYGDFIFGDMESRFGQSPISTLLGPTAGTIDDVLDLSAAWKSGEPGATQAFNTLINTAPGINLFYTRMVMDYMFLHNLREMANPGYLRRLERRVQKENAQSFILSPSSVIPEGGTFNPLEISGNIIEEVPDIEIGDLIGR